MRPRKRSFFEKLTGAINTNEPNDVEVNFNDDVAVEDTRMNQGGTVNTTEENPEEEEEGQLTVDVYQSPTEIVIKTMVAGVKPDTLDIQISRDMVTLRGTRRGSHEIKEEDYFYKELYWGTFSRTILLPAEVEVEEAEATEEHGLLTLRLPKIDKEKKTKLKVRSSR